MTDARRRRLPLVVAGRHQLVELVMRKTCCLSDVFVWHAFGTRNQAIDAKLALRLALESVGTAALFRCPVYAVKSRTCVHESTALQRLYALRRSPPELTAHPAEPARGVRMRT